MAERKIWPIGEHTPGKHLVLRHYLNAWLPIMGMSFQRILFIDGFSGPGEYEGGAEGSPIIALRALSEHKVKGKITAEVRFIFIEKDQERAEHLEGIVTEWKKKLPEKCDVDVVLGSFDETMTQVLGQLESQAKRLAPSFVMIDPFGVSDTPMSVIERILKNPRTEVYVSFMYEYINRFKRTEEFARPLGELFGTEEWREGLKITDSRRRKDFFYALYERQLRRAGAKYVVHLDLFRDNRLVYGVFFGTQHWLGSDRMKQSIWKIAPFGDFAFRGTKSPQLTLGLEQPDFEPLKHSLRDEFKGKGWRDVEEIEQFVGSDRTDYHTGQLRKHALVPMEQAGEIEINPATRKKKLTYPKGTLLRFI